MNNGQVEIYTKWKFDCVPKWIASYVGQRPENGMSTRSNPCRAQSRKREVRVEEWTESDTEYAENSDMKRVKTEK